MHRTTAHGSSLIGAPALCLAYATDPVLRLYQAFEVSICAPTRSAQSVLPAGDARNQGGAWPVAGQLANLRRPCFDGPAPGPWRVSEGESMGRAYNHRPR